MYSMNNLGICLFKIGRDLLFFVNRWEGARRNGKSEKARKIENTREALSLVVLVEGEGERKQRGWRTS